MASEKEIQVITAEQMGAWSLWEVICYLCGMPYALFGDDFEKAAMFIEGYAAGRHEFGIGGSYIGGENPELHRFTLWLRKRCSSIHGVHPRSTWWVYVLALFPNHKQAFENLPRLIHEFLEDT